MGYIKPAICSHCKKGCRFPVDSPPRNRYKGAVDQLRWKQKCQGRETGDLDHLFTLLLFIWLLLLHLSIYLYFRRKSRAIDCLMTLAVGWIWRDAKTYLWNLIFLRAKFGNTFVFFPASAGNTRTKITSFTLLFFILPHNFHCRSKLFPCHL